MIYACNRACEEKEKPQIQRMERCSSLWMTHHWILRREVPGNGEPGCLNKSYKREAQHTCSTPKSSQGDKQTSYTQPPWIAPWQYCSQIQLSAGQVFVRSELIASRDESETANHRRTAYESVPERLGDKTSMVCEPLRVVFKNVGGTVVRVRICIIKRFRISRPPFSNCSQNHRSPASKIKLKALL